MTDEEARITDHVRKVQEAISEIDPTSMCIGYVCAAEWLEEDGSTTFSLLHTPMPPWHMYGLLTYARSFTHEMYAQVEDPDEEEDEAE